MTFHSINEDPQRKDITMKRLLLFFISVSTLTLMCEPCMAQNSIQSGDEAFAYGYYKTAIEHYKTAYGKMDKKNMSQEKAELTYKIAEASRLSNDYDEAIKFYLAIYNSVYTNQCKECDFYIAQMYRNNEQYDSALLFYGLYLRTGSNDELLERAAQEEKACRWVLDSISAKELAASPTLYSIFHEGKNINSEYSESGAVMMGDSLLFFSSMRELSKPGSKNAINSDLVIMQLFQSGFSNGSPDKAEPNSWGLNDKEKHSCNIAFDPLHQNIYFTICEPDDFASIPCQIYVSHFNKGKWQKAKKVGGNVNMEGYSSTHPSVGYLADSTTILYFSSDRPGGLGGSDIWYTLISNGKTPTECVNLGAPVNTKGNEITPFYDNSSNRLYFSSDWHLGFGGYDIFVSEGMRDSWQNPVNMGWGVNSSANDLYFTVNPAEPGPASGYLTSNRRGSFFISDNTCCNDIYSWRLEPRPQPRVRMTEEPVIAMQKSAIHHLLPIKLYFHNDEPDPKSKLATTQTNYFQTYNRYMFMRGDYKKAHTYADGQVVYDSICDVIDYFFDYEVQYNCERFEEFLDLLLEDLKAGHRISMTVEGYASPIHTNKYNELISKRRIASIVNQIMEYKKGILTRYMGTGGGSLQIREVAYGSSHSQAGVSDDPRQTSKSVYSVEAARERRIEILDYQYLEDDSSLISCLHLPSRAMHIGTYKTGEFADIEVQIEHSALNETTLDFISVGLKEVKVVGYSKLTPGRKLSIYLRMDNRKAEPRISGFLPLTLRVDGEQVTQTMFLEYSIEK